jgi:hypothetical protein
MANRYPLIVNTTSGNSVQELPSGDFLDLSSSGISNSGNIIVSGIVSATGNVTGSYFIGNGSALTGIASGTPTKIVNGTSEANIGISGGNANITVAGTSNVLVVASTGIYTTGLSSVTGNITGGNISATNHTGTTVSVIGTVTSASVVGGVITGSSTSVTGTQTAASTVGGVITGSSASVTGTTTAASVVGGVITGSSTSVTGTTTAASVVGGVITGTSLSVSGSVTGGAHNGTSVSVSGTVTAASVVGGVITGSSTSVTGTTTAASTVGGVMTGTSLSLSGNTTPGNVLTGGLISAAGNITGGNISATNHTGTNVSVTGSITAGGDLSVVGNIVDTGALTIITSSNGNITLSPNGTGNINVGGNIMPVANATANIGSATLSFNTIFAKATSAQYADLAEMYCADSEYTPGTVLDFGGSGEVTSTTQSHSTQVAGIVSTNPSYLMNSTLTCTNAVQVALVGRVPCHVIGTIAKGDRLVASSIPGIATRLDMSQYQPGCIIGKALEAYDSETVGTIEVAVGRI